MKCFTCSTGSINFCNNLRLAYRFLEKLQQDIPGEGVKQQLQALCGIYYLSLLHKHQGDFLATSYITPKQAELANDQLRALYAKVRVLQSTFSLPEVLSISQSAQLAVSCRFVQMLLLWSTHSTTRTTSWVRFWAATTGMCTPNFTTRHGRNL